MDIALLFLPLIGGYVFARICNATRFSCAREEGQRLYFRAGFYAAFLFITAVLLRLLLIIRSNSYREFENLLQEIVSPFLESKGHEYQLPLTLVCLYAMALGPLLAVLANFLHLMYRLMVLSVDALLNRFWREKPFSLPKALRRTITPFQQMALSASPMDAMLQRSIQSELPIAVTMDSRKVYVGYVLETPDPERDTKAIRLLPLASGYREKDNLKIEFTTDYNWIYETWASTAAQSKTVSGDSPAAAIHSTHGNESAQHDPKDFEIVLPMSHVQSLNLFDFVAYARFQDRQEPVIEDNNASPDTETGEPTRKTQNETITGMKFDSR